jgi:ribosomal protein L16 Arg81 hydroxylase
MTGEVASLEHDPVAWLLGRADSASFVATELGRRWVLARAADPQRFARLLALADLDAVLGCFGVRHPAIKLVRADGTVPVDEYLWRDGLVDPARVAQLFGEGATVIFGALHDRHEPARRLCSAVAAQVSARTQTNVYLTPPHAQGFKPHWDTHDVFVLQVEGTKRWRIYGGGPALPMPDHKFDPAVHAAGAVEAEFTLEPGDALYIPRGIMHAAATTDVVSLHITLGVIAYTWADLLVDCLGELVERSPAWRESLPFGFGAGERTDPALRAALAERLAALAGAVDLDGVVRERQRSVEALLRPRVADHLQQVLTADALAPDDVVGWRDGVPSRLEWRDGRIALQCGGREVELPAAAAATIAQLRRGAPLVAGQVDDGLDWASRRTVLRALIREGWLVRRAAAG